jgi:hypothetical protein
MQKDYRLTTDQAAYFVIAAYKNLCPVPGAYDYLAGPPRAPTITFGPLELRIGIALAKHAA